MINRNFKNTPIYIGGQGVKQNSILNSMDNVVIMHSLDEIDSLV
jgi:hypothetical protein